MTATRYSLRRSLPRTVARDVITSLLHEPTTIFHLSPIIVGWEETEEGQDPGGRSRVFEVTDAVSFLPFGLYDTTVKVKIEFTNFEHGVVITKYAIFGLIFRETWTVEDELGSPAAAGQVQEPEGTHLELSLRVEMTGNPLTVLAFRGMMQRNHQMYLDKVVERAIEVSDQRGR